MEDVEGLGPIGCQVLAGIARIGLDADQVAPVTAAVREAPRDVPVAATTMLGRPGASRR